MSRTNHPRRSEISASHGFIRNGQRVSTRLTKSHWSLISFTPFDLVKADGNHWQGTISDVGGDARRKRQKDQRQRKILGRRIERRRLKERLLREDSNV